MWLLYMYYIQDGRIGDMIKYQVVAYKQTLKISIGKYNNICL